MSNVYSLEPPTSGKVILKTNFGNIDIELFTKEAPRACQNFLQHCVNSYYNKNVFFRIIKNFMIQTGDPTNTGKGGTSIWDKDFNDEFHSRLRFNHRGIVAMANKNTPNSNGSQFFITMDKCSWLDKKHTIFGKVVGDTFFNALNISELPTDKNDFPNTDTLPMIISVDIILNPLEDLMIKPKIIDKNHEITENSDKIQKTLEEFHKKKVINNRRLISFADEDDSDEEDNDKNNEGDNNTVEKSQETKEKLKLNKKEDEKKEEEEESVSLSESDEEVIKAKQKCNISLDNTKLSLDSERKEEIKRLKNDIQNMKKNITQKEIEQNEIKLTPLEKYNERFLQYKSKRPSKEEQIEKLKQFKTKLENIKKTNPNSWLNNKLKFQIDSQKSYALDFMREQQKKI